MRPALALALLAGCAPSLVPHSSAPPAASGPPGQPASAPAAAGPAPAPAVDRLAQVRAEVEALLQAQGEAARRAWSGGGAPDPAAAWAGREELLGDAPLVAIAAARATAPEEERLRLDRLRAFLLGEQLGRAIAEPARALATARAASTFTWEKRPVPLREATAILAGEAEAPRRRALAEAWSAALDRLGPLVAARDGAIARAARAAGFPDSLALAGALRAEPPAALAALAEATLSRTDATWAALLDALARREMGIPVDRLRERDLPRLLRTTADPAAFPAGRLVADATAAVAAAGVDPAAGGRIAVDAGAAAGKVARPLAIPLALPGAVVVEAVPAAGLDASRALLRELGVAEALAGTSPAAPLEDRWLGGPALPEAWGLLFEGIAASPAWLAARGLDAEAVRREVRVAAARRLHDARLAAARVLAEVARASDPAGAPARWPALAARALGHPWSAHEPLIWAADPDPLLRSAERLRAILLASRIEATLSAGGDGGPWWRAPGAGDRLRAAWAKGGAVTAAGLARDFGGEDLDAGALDDLVRAAAAAGGLPLPASPARPPPGAQPAPAR